MRIAEVYRNGILVGILKETENRTFVFEYDSVYYNDIANPAISLTMPKTELVYESKQLFPFFYNMLSEGANRAVQSIQLKIDEHDYFGLLLATAEYDTIGAITIKKIE